MWNECLWVVKLHEIWSVLNVMDTLLRFLERLKMAENELNISVEYVKN